MPDALRRMRSMMPLVAFCALSFCGWPASGEDKALAGRVRQRMQRFVDEKQVSGLVALIGRGDRIVCLEAIGCRDVERDLPMRPDVLFRIASMTKPITALGIMMLVEEGKLSVDDLVEKHLPEFRGQKLVASRTDNTVTLKNASRPITIRDLLTHTSGMPGAPPAWFAEVSERRGLTLSEAVIAYAQGPLEFEPGSKWSYSNTGIDILGRVIEVVSGRPYDEFLKDRLFKPLGMTDTTFYPNADQIRRIAVLYARKDATLQPAAVNRAMPVLGKTFPKPSGGLFSTAADLAKLYQVLLNRGTSVDLRYFSEAIIDEMTQIHTRDLKAGFSEAIGFGFGWSIVRRPTGVTESLSPGSFGHGGAFGTQCWIDPKKQVFTILMIQRSDMNPREETTIRRELPRLASDWLAE